jgi:hypothetical protein
MLCRRRIRVEMHCLEVVVVLVVVVAWCTDMACMHVAPRAGAVCGGNTPWWFVVRRSASQSSV